MKGIRRFLSILLIIALLLPGFAFADNQMELNDWQKKVRQDVIEKFSIASDKKIDRDSTNGLFKADEEVRVIVELETEPSLVSATKGNKSYKEFARAKELERKIELEQEKVKDNILSSQIQMDFIHNFKTAFNGFSGMVRYEDIEKIEKLPLVKKVYIANEYERPEPQMVTSHDFIASLPTWNLGYKGEGTVIAIIDSGIDVEHRDMVLSDDTVPRLTKELVESLIDEEDLFGRYYTEKVPYGYNYYDLNHEIKDVGPGASEHGMHVAGIAGANGDLENGGVKGVAPEAQLLAMKVFSNDPIYSSTFSDIYLKAIDEAVKLGADVLNMSLGSPAGFYIPDSAENVAITNATDNGIVCCVSAGNASTMTWGWESYDSTYLGYPWKQNPDIGVVGAPGLNKDTIQVASIDNSHVRTDALSYELDGEVRHAAMVIAGNIDPVAAFNGEPVEFVDGGSGHPSELGNVAGKIALIVRGGLTPNFVDKLSNAQAAGAIGVIVRNHESGGNELVNMATPDDLAIPAVFIGYDDGLVLMSLEEKYVTFTGEIVTVPNPTGGYMSDFTSWGTTPSLDIKPEITAPGGDIYSTMNDDKYGIMGGTSMATPHVAGGSALVMEYIKEHDKYSELSLSEQTRLAKVLLMNTAEILFDEYETEYSPRRQGAGLMNLYGAVTTPVRVVNADTNEAKVELRDFEDTSFTMVFKAINDSDTDVTYDVDVSVLTDYIAPYGGVELNILSSDYIYDATVDAPDTITVPANDEIQFLVTVDIGTDSNIYRNMFVEGFVTLTDPNDDNPTLSVPYVGFYGDWGEPNILDGFRFIDPAGSSYFNVSGMLYVDLLGSVYYYNIPNRIYMSPGTLDGFIYGTDNVLPYLAFLRNAEYVKYNILDAEGNNLRTILIQDYYRKDYVNGGRNYPADFIDDAWWFGDVGGKIVPDGDYFYEIEAKIHYDDAEVQSKRIPITIDTVAPEVSNIEFNQGNKKLSFNIIETSGVLGFVIYVNGEEIEREPVLVNEEEKLYELDLSGFLGETEVEIIVVDYAFNIGEALVDLDIEKIHPYIYLLRPILLDIYDSSDVLAEGYVANFERLDKVLINGIEADVEFVEYVDITHPEDPSTLLYSGPAYYFSKLMNLEDGYHEMTVEAIAETGDKGSIARMFFVDTTAPELNVEVINIDKAALTADLRIRMFDNLGGLKLYLGDSQIYNHEEPLVTPYPEEKVMDYTVNLSEGDNIFRFTLVDVAEHSTRVEVVINPDSIISNINPAQDVTLLVGETVEISFNAPAGGQGYYSVMLPFGLNSTNGTPMTEARPGFYTGTWTAPEDLIASGLKVEVTYVDANGHMHTKFAEGKISVVANREELPSNTVIVGHEAFDMDYLNNSTRAQEKVIQWVNEGLDIYIKLDDGTYVNQDGRLVDIEELPDELTYYDANGNKSIFTK